MNALLILSLLVIVIAAPVVDALACDKCKDILPLRDMQQRLTMGADQLGVNVLPTDADRAAPQEADATQELCPVCANIAAAMGNACCSPSIISQTNHLPKLIALSDPLSSINKPPQN